MDDEKRIQEFHRTNIFIWLAIIISILILSAAVYFLSNVNVFQPVQQAAQINQIIFFVAVVFAFAILFMKRSLFLPEKIISKIPQGDASIKIESCLTHLRKNYIIVWGLGEAIGVLGVVNYILTADLQYFLVFAVVGLYSVLINMPRIALPLICIERIRQST